MDIKQYIRECVRKVLSENQVIIDNFDKAIKSLQYNDPVDEFYFVQIIKRLKDNPDDDKRIGNYSAGSWYLGSYKIHSADELARLKPEIISVCEKNNARAYITLNKRSEKETEERVKFIKSTIANAKHVEDRVAGEAKFGSEWAKKRPRLLIDIDSADRNIWDEVHYILDMCKIQIQDEYETPSGGLHIIIPNYQERNFEYARMIFRKFDKGEDLGRRATVHPNADAKMILYSNTKTRGY